VADYPSDEVLELTEPAQHKALGNVVRHRILALLGDRAATISQLATALGVLKGSASFHVRTLEAAGLVHVVRTANVRGGVERYYGRTARRFEVSGPGRETGQSLLRNALAEVSLAPEDDRQLISTNRARLRADRVEAFGARLAALLEEFGAEPAAGEPMWALVVAMYPTGLPPTGADAR
jgi:DNA-binding transcriptional ArsR family regulator